MLSGELITLRPATVDDVATLAAIRSEPAVLARWRGEDLVAEIRQSIDDHEVVLYTIEVEGETIGAIQSYEEPDPDYRHAGLDIYLASAFHGRGFGSDAVRTLVRHLILTEGHHRVVIDPAADNRAAIAAYRKVGFRPVGTMRQYERGPDGTWHDGLLMELLAKDFES